MTDAWYRVASQSYGYLSALIIAIIVIMAARKILSDQRLCRRISQRLPQLGAAGTLRVRSSGGKRFTPGQEIPLPYEGTLGFAHRCDVRIPYRKIHMRSAFFWFDQGEMHLSALHSDGFHADGVPVEAGDEAVMGEGAELRLGELSFTLHIHNARHERPMDGPYVTPARQKRARSGHGEGIGGPGRNEERHEQRLTERQRQSEIKAEKNSANSRDRSRNSGRTRTSRKEAQRGDQAGRGRR